MYRLNPIRGGAGLFLFVALIVGVVLIMDLEASDVSLGVVTEVVGEEDQLIEIDLLLGGSRVVYVPSERSRVPLVEGDWLFAHHGEVADCAGTFFPAAQRLWRFPEWKRILAWFHPGRLTDALAANPKVSGIMGVALLSAPFLILRPFTAVAVGLIWSSLFGLSFSVASVFTPQLSPGFPLVVAAGFLIGLIFGMSGGIQEMLAQRLVVGGAALLLAPGLVGLLDWPTPLTLFVLLFATVLRPSVALWLIGSYLMAVGIGASGPGSFVVVLVIGGGLIFVARHHILGVGDLYGGFRARRLRPDTTGHIHIEQLA